MKHENVVKNVNETWNQSVWNSVLRHCEAALSGALTQS